MANQASFGNGAVDLPNPQKNTQLTYDPQVISGTIGSASGTSTPYDLCGWTLTAIELPGTLLAGTLTFQGARSLQDTFRTIYDTAGNQLSVIGTAGNQIITDIPELAPLRFIKIVAGGTQSSAQTINLFVK